MDKGEKGCDRTSEVDVITKSQLPRAPAIVDAKYGSRISGAHSIRL